MTSPGTKKPAAILCGFMGAGKTRVGRLLAKRLGVPFVDTDALIEEREGMSVARIFAERGEAHFRGREAEVCRELDASRGLVVATGGGMVTDADNFALLRSLGTTVYLDADVDTILNRVRDNPDRPLLAGAGDDPTLRERIAPLLASRVPAYRRCDVHVDTTRRTPEECVCDIVESLDAVPHRMIHLRVDTRPIPGRPADDTGAGVSRVVVGRGSVASAGDRLDRLGLGGGAMVLSPASVFDLHGARLGDALDERSIPWRHIPVDDGDASKTMDQAVGLLDALADAGADRSTAVIAMGGGVTGDVAGFVASIYMRGVPLVHVPTTLLAQVDASIGGKTGVNHPRAKNLIGAIYQPHLVLSDPDLLATLPPRQLANGMAEVIKTAIIDDTDLWETLRDAAGAGGRRPADPALLEECVARCARVKARIVEADPYERDRRRVLNLGHTLGHALESALSYAGILHGDAVALGTLAAWRVAVARGVADESHLEATRALMRWAGLPESVPAVESSAVRDALRLDKKRRDGRMVFVLPVAPGDVRVVDDVTEDELLSALPNDEPKGRP